MDFHCFSKRGLFLYFIKVLAQKQLNFRNFHWLPDLNNPSQILTICISTGVRFDFKNAQNRKKSPCLKLLASWKFVWLLSFLNILFFLPRCWCGENLRWFEYYLHRLGGKNLETMVQNSQKVDQLAQMSPLNNMKSFNNLNY